MKDGVEAGRLLQQARFDGQAQRTGQKVQPLDVAAHGQQPPAVVAAHAVGLEAGEGGQVLAGAQQAAPRHGQGGQAVAALAVAGEQGMEEIELGLLQQLPVFGRQAFAHGGR